MPATDWIRILTFLATMAASAGLPGCASGTSQSVKPRVISVSDFSSAAHTISATTSTAASTSPSTSPAAAFDSSTPASRPNLLARGPDVSAASTFPGTVPPATAPATGKPVGATAPPPAMRPGERLVQPGDVIIVESVIGQVSGQPIFADAFLEPIAGRLRTYGETSKPGEFSQRAAGVILEQLRQIVLSDLFLAEAEASLTPEQQQGLLAFVRRLKQDLISGSGGLETQAEARSQEQGKTLQQTVEERRDIALIQKQINDKVTPRVIVTWKDIEREYQRRLAEFNPPASVTLSRLRLDGKDPKEKDQIEEVKSRLAAGEDFNTIGQSIGPPAYTTLGAFLMGPGGISDVEVNPKYKPALANVKLGQTTEPIDMGDSTLVWLHVDKIDQPPPKTLFEVQGILAAELDQQRKVEEREKYIKALFERGIYDDLRNMGQRALIVARMRYER